MYSSARVAAWPTHVRITVATKLEMEKFQAVNPGSHASQTRAQCIAPERGLWTNLDGRRARTISPTIPKQHDY